jgi:hypothetical protein
MHLVGRFTGDGSNNVTISPGGAYFFNNEMVWSPGMGLDENPYIYDMQP